ncbi:TetR/AcrR family transcriptional regulator [Mycobacterium sp. PDNC021]|uniref:TetR/AcrR family transcriptional regulator n=1 Tax=Mycobacterium sp. PDNC021 TaxID=3391399 RepID=UPI003AAFB5D6
MARSRLTPDQRRDQILDLGMAAFSVTPFEQVSMEDIATQAGISRALIYHYFPSKKELFAALWARAHEQLSDGSHFTPTRTVREQVRAALVTYYAFYERNLTLVMIANRSAIAADPVVRDPITMELNDLRDRIANALDLAESGRDMVTVALSGWLALVREVALEWLGLQRISRESAVDLCMSALDGLVAPHADLNRPPRELTGQAPAR